MKKIEKINTNNICLFLISLVLVIVFLLAANRQEPGTEVYDIVILGDSVVGNDIGYKGVEGVMEERLGKRVFNGALGGTCMSYSNVSGWESLNTVQWSMVKLAEAIYAEDWTSVLATVSYAQNYNDMNGQLLDYFYERIQQLSRIDFSRVEILIIEHGTNDYNSGQPLDNSQDAMDQTTYGGALRKVLTMLQKKYPNLRIVLSSPIYCEFIYIEDAKCYEKDFGGGVLDDYVEMERRIAADYGVEFIDMYHGSGIWSHNIEEYLYDGLHPVAAGQDLIGNALAEYLMESEK